MLLEADQRTDVLVILPNVIKKVDYAFAVHGSLDSQVTGVQCVFAQPTIQSVEQS